MESPGSSAVLPEPRSFLRTWFWVVPAIVTLATYDSTLATVVVTSVVAGVLWQLVHPRDLADRLTYVAILYLVPLVSVLVIVAMTGPSGGRLSVGGNGPLSLLLIVLAMVLTEQGLRLRDDRRARRTARAQAPSGSRGEGTVPAGP